MDSGTILFLLLVLACPLVMLLAHRTGGHGTAHDHDRHHRACERTESPEELRRRRDDLSARIDELERAGAPQADGERAVTRH